MNKMILYTVKPPKRGHFGVSQFVLCREVVLSQRFVFKCYRLAWKIEEKRVVISCVGKNFICEIK